MSENVETLYKIAAIKNQLVAIDEKVLLEIHKDKDAYVTFIENLSLLINNDSCFIVLDERIMDKIQKVIQVNRFSFDNPEAKEYINELIKYINTVRAYPESIKNILKNGYLNYNEEERETCFRSHSEFLNSLATDGVVFAALLHDRLDIVKNYDYALMSLNYIMKNCPELFKDEEIRQRAEKIIELADKNSRTFTVQKQRVKKTKRNYMNLNDNNML